MGLCRYSSDGKLTREESGSVDMRAFSTTANSSLYISPAIEAGTGLFVHDGDEVDVDEGVLPPLPNADEQEQFENVLRRFGWASEEEEEDNKHRHHARDKLKWSRAYEAASSTNSGKTPATT